MLKILFKATQFLTIVALLSSYPVSIYVGKVNIPGDGANGATPTNVALNNPSGVYYDSVYGYLYLADTVNSRIRQITVATYTQKYFAGNGQTGYAANKATGSPTQVILNNPVGLSGDSSGNIYISDTNNHCIRKVDATGTNLVLLAGGCSQQGYADSSTPTSVRFSKPRGLFVDSTGIVYVADSMNFRIRQISPTGVTTTLAGTGTSGYSSLTGAGTSIPLYAPRDVWGTSVGDLYVADFTSVRKIVLSTSEMSLYGGNNQAGMATVENAVATQTNLDNIMSVHGDSYGNLYLGTGNFSSSSVTNRKIYILYASTNKIATLIGNGTSGNALDSTMASMESAYGIGADGLGNLFFADALSYTIKKAVISFFIPPTPAPTSQPSSQPSRQPTSQPTRQPTSQPTRQPYSLPSQQPSVSPSSQPTSQPTLLPTMAPSARPSTQPSSCPSSQPTTQPSSQPFLLPTAYPSSHPSRTPSRQPSSQPSCLPTSQPSSLPTSQPSILSTSQPSSSPTIQPSVQPSGQPSSSPTSQPSSQSTSRPSISPTTQPSANPTGQPSSAPSLVPSWYPSAQPTNWPSVSPSILPTSKPTSEFTPFPSSQPTLSPSSQPSSLPSSQPTNKPSPFPSNLVLIPSFKPSETPTLSPLILPSSQPTSLPTGSPSSMPSSVPSAQPSCSPTLQPSSRPSCAPSSSFPTNFPTQNLIVSAPTLNPFHTPTPTAPIISMYPSYSPSNFPTHSPSNIPSFTPTLHPSYTPSISPTTHSPSNIPSSPPSFNPSSFSPTSAPTISIAPISSPPSTLVSTWMPSPLPSLVSVIPTLTSTQLPTCAPTVIPSYAPSISTDAPSISSVSPTNIITQYPTISPSSYPSSQPSHQPTTQPTSQPTNQQASGVLPVGVTTKTKVAAVVWVSVGVSCFAGLLGIAGCLLVYFGVCPCWVLGKSTKQLEDLEETNGASEKQDEFFDLNKALDASLNNISFEEDEDDEEAGEHTAQIVPYAGDEVELRKEENDTTTEEAPSESAVVKLTRRLSSMFFSESMYNINASMRHKPSKAPIQHPSNDLDDDPEDLPSTGISKPSVTGPVAIIMNHAIRHVLQPFQSLAAPAPTSAGGQRSVASNYYYHPGRTVPGRTPSFFDNGIDNTTNHSNNSNNNVPDNSSLLDLEDDDVESPSPAINPYGSLNIKKVYI